MDRVSRRLDGIHSVKHINKHTMGRIVSVYEGQSVQMKDMTGLVEREGRAHNDNYNSTLKQIAVSYSVSGTEKTLHLLIKIPPSNFLATVHKLVKPFTKESLWYSTCVGELVKVEPKVATLTARCLLATTNSLRDGVGCCEAKCHWICWCPCQSTEQGLIILENLTKRQKPLTLITKTDVPSLEHVCMIMRHLAILHGSWWLYLHKLCDGQIESPPWTYAELREKYKVVIPTVMIKSLIHGSLELLEKVLLNAKHTAAAEWIRNYKSRHAMNRTKYLMMGSPPNTSKILTIGHGDFWSNNLMFHHDADGKPDEMILIDMANNAYGHPTIDIIYFLYVNTDAAFRKNYTRPVLLEYFNTFDTYLKQAGFQFTFENFQKEYELHKDYGLLMGAQVMSNVLSPIELELNTFRDMTRYNAQRTTNLLNVQENEHPTTTMIRTRLIEIGLEFSSGSNFG